MARIRYAHSDRSVPAGEETELLFTFKLEQEDGSPAEPPTFHTPVSNWSPGDQIPLGGSRSLRVIAIRPGPEPDDDSVLVVEAA